MASNMTAFFEHLTGPGYAMEQFQSVAVVGEKSLELMTEWQSDPTRLIKMAERMQGIGAATLNYIAQAEAMAYTLQVYTDLIDWKPKEEERYRLVPPSLCCHYAKLPRALVQAIKSKTELQEQQVVDSIKPNRH
eukprot:gene6831-30805_t